IGALKYVHHTIDTYSRISVGNSSLVPAAVETSEAAVETSEAAVETSEAVVTGHVVVTALAVVGAEAAETLGAGASEVIVVASVALKTASVVFQRQFGACSKFSSFSGPLCGFWMLTYVLCPHMGFGLLGCHSEYIRVQEKRRYDLITEYATHFRHKTWKTISGSNLEASGVMQADEGERSGDEIRVTLTDPVMRSVLLLQIRSGDEIRVTLTDPVMRSVLLLQIGGDSYRSGDEIRVTLTDPVMKSVLLLPVMRSVLLLQIREKIKKRKAAKDTPKDNVGAPDIVRRKRGKRKLEEGRKEEECKSRD
ncbi:hypothetical protein STEG23_008253, partial [Scotinomys teguina]